MNMSIYKAILKYGHSNFILQIIEICDPSNVINREQYYLDNFDFDYNVLSKANSSSGFKHSEATLAKMKGRKNALGLKHKEETKKRLSVISSMQTHNEDSLLKMRELWAVRKFKSESPLVDALSDPSSTLVGQPASCTATNFSRGSLAQESWKDKKRKAPHSKKIIVTNIEDKTIKKYNSIVDASISLNINRSTLRNYIAKQNVLTIIKVEPVNNILKKEKYLIEWDID